MTSINKFTASVASLPKLDSVKHPALPPLAHGEKIDPHVAATGPNDLTSYTQQFLEQRLGTFNLPDLDGFTKWTSRMTHYVQGPEFPEYGEGFFSGRLIDGTNGNDHIQVRYEPSTGGAYITRSVMQQNAEGVWVDTGKKTTSYLNAEESKSLYIRGNEGDDRIEVDARFPYPVRISGGSGNDYMSGGKGADSLSGGAGDDLIFGNAGYDRVDTTMEGNDHIYLGADQDYTPPILK